MKIPTRFKGPLLVALFLLLPAASSFAQDAAPAAPVVAPLTPSPLKTRWAKNVSPTNPLPEYPRPQMTRKTWQSLNGPWQFAIAAPNEAAPLGKEMGGKILVPFPVESSLSGVEKRAERVWYRRTFTVPAKWRENNQRTLLHFGAVDWEATVYLNGRQIGTHRGGYDGFDFDVTAALKPGEATPQEIVVGVYDPTDKGKQPRGKQVSNPEGIYYTPITGIWQTVWMEPVPAAHISRLQMTPDVAGKSLRLTVQSEGSTETGLEVVAEARDSGGRRIGEVVGAAGKEMRLPVPSPRLWSPDDPYLYNLRVSLRPKNARAATDTVDSYFALRSIERKSVGGIQRLLLNGKFVFQMGVLDQGFWPDGLYTAPTDEALKYDIEMTKKLGFNMSRKHVKVEPERWYYWADKLGVLVWQDMPSGNKSIGPNDPDVKRDPEDARQFEQELKAMIEGRGNHPSIILWVVFNEGWGQYETARITALAHQLDPSRLINSVSGWADRGVGDMMDMHKYPSPGSPKPEAARAAVLGEYGGLGLPVKDHVWSGKVWGYRGMASAEELTRRYVQFMRQVWQLKESPGLSAAVYTQLTDVETEVNGLLTYDRAVIKPDLKQIASANRGELSALPLPVTLVPTSENAPQVWRYTFDKPAADWMSTGFTDTSWKSGPGGFGTQGTPGAVVRTTWNTPDIYLRRSFELPAGQKIPGGLRFLLNHDEDVEIYINGVLAGRVEGYNGEYEEIAMTDAGRAALKPGRNVIAVHCRQTAGGQAIDVGIIGDKDSVRK